MDELKQNNVIWKAEGEFSVFLRYREAGEGGGLAREDETGGRATQSRRAGERKAPEKPGAVG